jgi:hypothetical protein
VALCRGEAEAKLVRGTLLRMTDLRFRSAYISVAVNRPTESWRIVELLEPVRHHRAGGAQGECLLTAQEGDQEAQGGASSSTWCWRALTGPSRLPLRAAFGRP